MVTGQTSDRDKTLLIIKPSLYQEHIDRIVITEVVRKKLYVEDSIFYKIGEIPQEQILELYKEHQKKYYYDSLLYFMMSGNINIYKIIGEDAFSKINNLKGRTNPKESAPDSIRGRFRQFSFAVFDNFIHAPTSVEEAKRELDIFFT